MLPSQRTGRLHERRVKQLGKFDDRAVTARRESRWKSFLQQQDVARTVQLQQLRDEVLQSVVGSHSDIKADDTLPTEIKHPRSHSLRQTRVWMKAQYFARQLVIPETLCSIPEGFAAEWLCYIRPEGSRGLLFCIDGVANLRVKSGLSFGSQFECGIPGNGFTVLDVVVVTRSAVPREQDSAGHESALHEGSIRKESVTREDDRADCSTMASQKRGSRRKQGSGALQKVAFVYVVDVLSWKNCDLTSSTAECRQWYLQARFDEIEEFVSQSNPRNRLPLRVAKFNDCSSETLVDVYSEKHSFVTDSIVFVHREAFYISGLNPLYLLFRDRTLSRWVVDSGSVNDLPQQQEACLTIVADPENDQGVILVTADNYVLHRVSVNDLKSSLGVDHPGNGCLLKIAFKDIDSSRGCLNDVSFKGQPSVLRCNAESLGRVVAQHCARCGVSGVLPTFGQLVRGEPIPPHAMFSNFVSVCDGSDNDDSCGEDGTFDNDLVKE